MIPEQVPRAVRAAWLGVQSALGMRVQNVIYDRIALCQNQIAIRHNWSGPQRRERLVVGRCKIAFRIAIVALQLVFGAQLFEQPEDAETLRIFKMVECQHASGLLLRSIAGGSILSGFSRKPRRGTRGNGGLQCDSFRAGVTAQALQTRQVTLRLL